MSHQKYWMYLLSLLLGMLLLHVESCATKWPIILVMENARKIKGPVEHFKPMFLVFKQHYTYFYTFLHTYISKKYKQHYLNSSTKWTQKVPQLLLLILLHKIFHVNTWRIVIKVVEFIVSLAFLSTSETQTII